MKTGDFFCARKEQEEKSDALPEVDEL